MWLRRAVQRPYGPRRAPRLGGRALGFALATFLLSVAPSQLLAQGQSAGTTAVGKDCSRHEGKGQPELEDARSRERASLRLPARADLRRRKRPDLLRRRRSRSGSRHARPQGQSPQRAGQRPLSNQGRQCHSHGRDRSRRGFPRRLHQFAAGGDGRPHAFRGGTRRAQRRKSHGARERRLHGVRAVQEGPDAAAALAGEGGAHHPQRERAGRPVRKRVTRVLRCADRLRALLLASGSDREACRQDFCGRNFSPTAASAPA